MSALFKSYLCTLQGDFEVFLKNLNNLPTLKKLK